MAILTTERGEIFEAVEMGTPTIAYANEVTPHTIPRGAPVYNHIQPQARRLSTTLRVVGLKTRLGSASTLAALIGRDLYAEARYFFERNQTALFEYNSDLIGVLPRLALVSWDYGRNYMGHVDFALEFVEVRSAVVVYVDIPPERRKKPKDEPPKDKGDTGADGKKFAVQTEANRLLTLADPYISGVTGVPIIRNNPFTQGGSGSAFSSLPVAPAPGADAALSRSLVGEIKAMTAIADYSETGSAFNPNSLPTL